MTAAAPPQVERNPDRNAYFRETHAHTSWSLDAWVGGDRITDPGDAYKYFKGQPIKHPLGHDVKIDTPLDWAGVTDHSEYVGVAKMANDPSSPICKLPAAKPLILQNVDLIAGQCHRSLLQRTCKYQKRPGRITRGRIESERSYPFLTAMFD